MLRAMAAALDTEALAQLALASAEEAAKLVMRGYRAQPRTRTKHNEADLVTEFDEAAEALLRERLSAQSDLPIVGEEGGGELTNAATWVIDPIDGTTNFAHGHAYFAVSVAIMQAKQPLVGAVVAPALGVRWHGTAERAFRNGQPIVVSRETELRRALVATGFAPDAADGESERNLAAVARLLSRTRGIRRDGSAALDACMTADGTFGAYWERSLRAWDIAGGAAIALGAGATITDLQGGAPDFTRGYVLISNGHLHPAILAELATA